MLLILLESNGIRELQSLLVMRAYYSLIWLFWSMGKIMTGKSSGNAPFQYFSCKNSEQSPPYQFLSENLVKILVMQRWLLLMLQDLLNISEDCGERLSVSYQAYSYSFRRRLHCFGDFQANCSEVASGNSSPTLNCGNTEYQTNTEHQTASDTAEEKGEEKAQKQCWVLQTMTVRLLPRVKKC